MRTVKLGYRVHVLDLDTGVEGYYPDWLPEGVAVEDRDAAEQLAAAVEEHQGWLSTVEEVEIDPNEENWYESFRY